MSSCVSCKDNPGDGCRSSWWRSRLLQPLRHTTGTKQSQKPSGASYTLTSPQLVLLTLRKKGRWSTSFQLCHRLGGFGQNAWSRKTKTHPWKHSRPGWTGLWATWSSWRCPCSLQGAGTRWPLKAPSNPNHSGIRHHPQFLPKIFQVEQPKAENQ